MRIPVTKPYIGEEEGKVVLDVLKSGWLVQGPMVAKFENMICQYTGAQFAKATTSCTTALHLALVALGIGPGDEVIVPSFTYVASANAVEYTGAKPVFVDIDLDTFNIATEKVEEYLEWTRNDARVKAIMPVHRFGLCADMDAVMKLAKKQHLLVIEDAACALGSLFNARHAGTFGEVGCYSFHPRKLITTGEGGMLVTNIEDINAKLNSLRDHGTSLSDFARHEAGAVLLPDFNILGYNYRMTDMQGAIGVEQLKKIQYIIDQRARIAKMYDAAFSNIPDLATPIVPSGYKHTYQSYVVTLVGPKPEKMDLNKLEKLHEARNMVMLKLSEKGIAARQGTSAVHSLGYYSRKYGYKKHDFPMSLQADYLTISLPIYPQMTEDEQAYVIETMLKVMKTIPL